MILAYRPILQRLRTTIQSLLLRRLIDQWPFQPLVDKHLQSCASWSGLTQLVRIWESLACLHLCSGSPVGRWWKPCSCNLATQWSGSCFQWAPRCSAGVCCVVGHLLQHFCCCALRRALNDHILR